MIFDPGRAAVSPVQQAKLNKQLIDQYVAAGSQGSPEKMLCGLSGHFCDKIRAQVAGNPATPPSVLTRLARDSNRDVREAVAANPSAPRTVLDLLVHDGDEVLRYELACDIDLPTWMLEVLALDKIAWVSDEAFKTLAIVAPEKYCYPIPPTYQTVRPCIDICNPWWRKSINQHPSCEAGNTWP